MIAQAKSRLADSAEIKVALVVVDDLHAGWTNRHFTGYLRAPAMNLV